MVDRITPATSWEDIATLPARVGFEDAWPVMCEPYKHWVIEDNFVDGARPSWEDVGALLVPDVVPHELMKVRLLNVTHSAMCYAGILAGCTHVHEAATHSKMRAFLEHLMVWRLDLTSRAPCLNKAPRGATWCAWTRYSSRVVRSSSLKPVPFAASACTRLSSAPRPTPYIPHSTP
jgi:mannitol-1-phosphate/altronate dehydrogenase